MDANVCVYMYIFIGIHRQTVSLYHNSSVWLDTRDAPSRDRNPHNYVRLMTYPKR